MDAWLASPYRAIGIYLGGQNRACADGKSYARLGEQRSRHGLEPAAALGRPAGAVRIAERAEPDLVGLGGSQGKSAADGAALRAAYFGLEAGSPIYYDMEGYKTSASCTVAVQRFVRSWTNELHVQGLHRRRLR